MKKGFVKSRTQAKHLVGRLAHPYYLCMKCVIFISCDLHLMLIIKNVCCHSVISANVIVQ